MLVNRIWGWHFGQALVRTPNDFGAQGEPPTHPRLLDWLARDLQNHGWKLKDLHRRIMLSSTYQMASIPGPRTPSSAPGKKRASAKNGLEVDPQNRLLWHFPRHRLEGEAIRDAMLACAGTLNLQRGGPPVVPPLNVQELTGLFDSRGKWPVTKDVTEHTRRSVYLLVRRTFPYPLLAAFDSPEQMTSCAQRLTTVVPAQALTLLNSPVAREQSLAFARRLANECPGRTEQQVTRAWRLALGRAPSMTEAQQAQAFLQSRAAALARGKGPADHSAALAELCLVLFNANEFVTPD